MKIDPKRASELHPNDRFRVLRAVELCRLLEKPVSELKKAEGSEKALSLTIKIETQRDWLKKRILLRAGIMLDEGLLSEVKKSLR